MALSFLDGALLLCCSKGIEVKTGAESGGNAVTDDFLSGRWCGKNNEKVHLNPF